MKKAYIVFTLALATMLSSFGFTAVNAMPFYSLNPQERVLRSEFSTTYSKSSLERKHNIKLASQSIDNYFLDSGSEFSFNSVVGKRTENRGYKRAKIILNGNFVDGVGGGVCQVSTTLYNAVLLAGLTVLEYHPHSLAVSYVKPSFDAMVNENWADLRFLNNTQNPIVIRVVATDEKVTFKIYGQPMQDEVRLISQVTGEIVPPIDLQVLDVDKEYSDLFEGQTRQVVFPKKGLTSRGYVEIISHGKVKSRTVLRSDKYAPIRGKTIIGTIPNPEINYDENLNILN